MVLVLVLASTIIISSNSTFTVVLITVLAILTISTTPDTLCVSLVGKT